MRSLAFIGLGIGFIVMGAGLFALTLRKGEAPPAHPNSKQQRELAALAVEKKKMHFAAAGVAGLGAVLIGLSYL